MTLDELSDFVEQQRLLVEAKTRQNCTILLEQDRSQHGVFFKLHVMYGPASAGPHQYGLPNTEAASTWLRAAVEDIPAWEAPAAIAPWFEMASAAE